jgi:hypothetical protein
MNHDHVINAGAAPIQIGDSFPMAEADIGDCPALSAPHPACEYVRAPCVLSAGHDGAHVCSDGMVVIAVWTDSGEG